MIYRIQKALLALLLALISCGAMAQVSTKSFDHIKTGFALSGMHSNTRCESCHVNGVFKGTPRDCASCHVSGLRLAKANVVKPSNHFQTPLGCESCHTTVTFTGAKFDHLGVAPTACASCHNGAVTTGKPSGHIPTQAACSTCHKTTGWVPATGMDHSGMTAATNCASCHNGSSATGKSAVHISTTLNCTSCHTTTGWKPTSWNHTQVPVANQCSTCHSGSNPPADGPGSNHIPYKALSGVTIANCDSCHKGGFASWNPGAFHSNVAISTQCATCHYQHPCRRHRYLRGVPQNNGELGGFQAGPRAVQCIDELLHLPQRYGCHWQGIDTYANRAELCKLPCSVGLEAK